MRIAIVSLLALSFNLVGLPKNLSAEEPAKQPPAVDRIEQALDTKITIELPSTNLKGFAAALRYKLKVNVLLDEKALEDAGVSGETPRSINGKDLPARVILHRVLDDVDLTFYHEDDVLYISTPDKAATKEIARVYDVHDLALVDESPASYRVDVRPYDFQSLINVIQTSIHPESWGEGNNNNGTPSNGCLFFLQTREVHREIDALLAALRKAKAQRGTKDEYLPIVALPPREAEFHARAMKALNQRGSLNFDKPTLEQAAEQWSKQLGVPVLLDRKAFEDAGVGTDAQLVEFSAHLSDVRLLPAMNSSLAQFNLTISVNPSQEAVLITTSDKAATMLRTVVYPVADLVVQDLPSYRFRRYSGDYPSLMNVLTATLYPETWDNVGSLGTMSPLRSIGVLVISQTDEAHAKVSALLADLRAARAKRSADTPATSSPEFETKIHSLAPFLQNGPGLDAKEVAALLPEVIEPESWKAKDVFLRPISNRLVIRQTPAIQQKIGKFLDELQSMPPGTGGMGGGMGGGFF